jgi:hypothetical protein
MTIEDKKTFLHHAVDNGPESIQVRNRHLDQLGWTTFANLGALEEALHSNAAYLEWRIKPTPKKRLMRPEDFPVVFWVQGNGSECWGLCTFVGPTGLRTSNDPLLWPYEVLGRSWVWSPDRKEIKSFFVEEGA